MTEPVRLSTNPSVCGRIARLYLNAREMLSRTSDDQFRCVQVQVLFTSLLSSSLPLTNEEINKGKNSFSNSFIEMLVGPRITSSPGKEKPLLTLRVVPSPPPGRSSHKWRFTATWLSRKFPLNPHQSLRSRVKKVEFEFYA